MRKIETEQTKQIKIKPRKITSCKSITCDICNKIGYPLDNNEYPKSFAACNWGVLPQYYSNKSAIYAMQKIEYPGENINIEGKYIDICNDCMIEKVFPLIEKHLDIKPRSFDYNVL